MSEIRVHLGEWRSTGELVRLTGKGESTVRRQLRGLREAGELDETVTMLTYEREADKHRKPGRVYRLTAAASKNGARAEGDFYPTPVWVLARFLEAWRPLEPVRSILEPCAGDGGLLPLLRERFRGALVDACDLTPRHKDVQRADFLTLWPGRRRRYDLVITNPPFSDAIEIINAAFARVRPGGYVVMLLRESFLASRVRDGFWRAHPCAEVFHLVERPSFRAGGGSDYSDYVWIVWRCDGKKRRSWRGRRI